MADAAARLLADIREMAPAIAERAAEIEAGRQIPADLVAALKSIGVFRLFVPRQRGGLELDLPAGLEVLAALSRIEASVGWAAAIAGGCDMFATLLPRELYEQVAASGPDAIIAGSTQPAGTVERVADGWRVSGRWPFASGCTHADWMFGFCVVTEDGTPLPGPGGAAAPMIRGVFLPARDWKTEDTWHVAGLLGTGSHHISLERALVSELNLFDPASETPCAPGPLYRAILQLLPLLHGAVSVGIAEGALDALIALAKAGHQQFRALVPLRESQPFQDGLGRVAAEQRAARAVLDAQGARHWRRALAGTLKDEAPLVEGGLAASWLADICVRIADECFALAGTSAIYESSPLQRRLRDMHVAAAHAAAHRRHYAAAGKLLLAAGAR